MNARSALLIGAGFAAGCATAAFFNWSRASAAPAKWRAPQVTIAQKSPPLKSAAPAAKRYLAPGSDDPGDTSSLNAARAEREKGNYVLDFDIPYMKEKFERGLQRRVDMAMELYGPEYKKKFDELGIDPATQAQLLHHVAQVHRAKITARNVQTALANAQADYDRRLSRLLGDKYEDYAIFETASRARTESTRLNEFAAQSGSEGLAPDRLAAVTELIHTHEGYSMATNGYPGGVFDDIATPRVGNSVIPDLQARQARLAESVDAMLKDARERGFSATEIGLLESHYNKELVEYESTIADMRDPVGAQLRRLERRAQNMNKDPGATPQDRRSLEFRIQSLRAISTPLPGNP